jgi:hypothetical protein
VDAAVIAGRPWVRWTFGLALPIACFVHGLSGFSYLPLEPALPRAGILGWALVCLGAMALSTHRRACSAPASMTIAGVLLCGVPFALANAWVLRVEIVFAFLLFWVYVPFAVASPAAALVYAACAFDELRRAARRDFVGWIALAAGLAAPVAAAALAELAVRRTETLLMTRLIDPEVSLDESALALLRPIGWIDPWKKIEAVRRTWLDEEPPRYNGRALRARQVLHALTGRFSQPPPGTPSDR